MNNSLLFWIARQSQLDINIINDQDFKIPPNDPNFSYLFLYKWSKV
jgi:hypothetical protein